MGSINVKRLIPLFLIVTLASCQDETIDLSEEGLIGGRGEEQNSDTESRIISANENVFILEDTSIVLSDLLDNDLDDLGGVLTILSFTQSINGGSVELAGTNILKYTPALNYHGLDSFAYVITNSQGVTATARVNINVEPINDLPQVTNENIVIMEDELIILKNLMANAVDLDGDTLTIFSFQQGTFGSVVLTSENTLTYTPAADFSGLDSFSYEIADGSGENITGTVNIEVKAMNDAPSAVDDSVEVLEDESIALRSLLENDSDIDGDTLFIESFSQTDKGGALKMLEDNILHYVPPTDFFGTDRFTYVVSDAAGEKSSATVTILVKNVNDAPHVVGESTGALEDESLLLSGLLNNDSDVDGDKLLIVSFTQSLQGGVVEQVEENVLKYIPALNFFGADSFKYSVSDGNGALVEALVSINVQSVNDVLFIRGEVVETQEDESLLLRSLLDNDMSVDGGKLLISGFTQSEQGGLVELTEENVLRYVPPADYNGEDSFSYSVSDTAGDEGRATVMIVVKSVNDLPSVSGESVETAEDTSLLLSNLLANDSDKDADKLKISSFTQSDEGGVVELTSENVLRYTPPADFNGADSFTYMVSDNVGAEVPGIVAITVVNVNDIPVVLGEAISTSEDTSIQLTQLLDNDTDKDGDTLALSSFTQSEQGGAVELVTANILRYIPAENFYGEDSFTYTVIDGAGGEASATVAVTVVSVNDVPVAKADSFSVTQNVQKVLDVLTNDQGLGDQVQVSFVSAPSNGDLVLSADQVVTYAPTVDYFGPDSFVYQLKDGDGEVSIATVSLEVDCVSKCDRTFEVSWVASVSANVAGYKVYYGTDEGSLDTVVTLGNVTSYDHFVNAKGVYYFAVSAFNDQSIESELTSAVSGVF